VIDLEPRRPTTLAFDGIVAAPHYLASAAGLAALRDGGTALDAAIAANAVLTVVYPDQTSIGGDCFLLYHEAATATLHAYNGSGRTPAAGSLGALRAAGYTAMPARGIHAVTVPGTIDAWAQASERFGRLGLDRLLRPAIDYARHGFPVSPGLGNGIANARSLLEREPEAGALYLPGGAAPRAGDRLRLPQLAESLALIARDGRDAFYRGQIAERIAATATRLGGTLTTNDLAAHRGEWVEPLTTTYRGVTVAEFPPNSQGLTALLELNLVANVALPTAWGSAEHLHPLLEAKRLAFAVRDAELADPAHAAIDTARLLSPAFAAELWRGYDPDRAAGGRASAEGDTVYLCAIDRDGNAASLIQSIYQGFGSGIVADGTGIVLQNRGAYFRFDPAHPNAYGPGKRTLHTLMPAMLYRDGRLWGPLGTQGGDVQAQVHLQLVTDLVDYGMEPQAAIEAPRWVAGGAGEDGPTVALESRFPAATVDGLRQRGYRVVLTGPVDPSFGHAQMILRDPETGLLRGAADPRADGAALGY
jgi:gamma-glutamyltranspeptidase/glutathione hydrolase